MRNVTLKNMSEVVVEAIGATNDVPDTQKEIMTPLVRPLHGVCKEVNLTTTEFMQASEEQGAELFVRFDFTLANQSLAMSAE